MLEVQPGRQFIMAFLDDAETADGTRPIKKYTEKNYNEPINLIWRGPINEKCTYANLSANVLHKAYCIKMIA